MDQSKASSTDKSDGAALSRRHNNQVTQNVLLVWLDSNNDANSTDCQSIITQIRRVVNDVNIFIDSEECIQFLGNIIDNKACMIISGYLGQYIVPLIHNMSQVDSIFIFCSNRKRHEQWAKEWSKIKGVFTEISPICQALKQVTQQCEQNAISISFVATDGDVSKKNLDHLDPTFIYSQILKEILLSIEFNEGHILDFIEYCRTVFADNETELKNVDNLQRMYHDKTPIWWYTYECFLYPMLNRALRFNDIDIIIKMGFFIDDLHRHIDQLHSEQFNSDNSCEIFTVYRGQGMSKKDFDQMTKIQGGLMSFNNFLSTSKERHISVSFARGALSNPDLIGILFIMTIDPTKSITPFASIVDVSYYEDAENEVLFSMHTVFRIGAFEPMSESERLFQVQLTLTSDNDKDLCILTDRIRQETFPHDKGWQRLGLLLHRLGQSEKSQQVFETLMQQTTDDIEKGNIYERLGIAKRTHGEYNEALECFENSLAIRQQSFPWNHPSLGYSYHNIGMAHFNMNHFLQALSSYDKAFKIWQQSLPLNHPDWGMFYTNMGEVHRNMSDYPRALSYYEKALDIRQKLLPSNHPHLASSYNNVGMAYRNIGNYPKALSSYEKALEIQQQSLPSNHPHLTVCYNNIGNVYDNMGDYLQARLYYERAVENGQHSLPTNHRHLQIYRGNLDRVKAKLQ